MIELHGNDCEIVLYGVSMGSAAVSMASGEESLQKQVKAVISACAFTDMWNQVSRVVKMLYKIPAAPFMWGADAFMKTLAGYGMKDTFALNQVKNSSVTTLFIHGSLDDYVFPDMAKTLFDCFSSEKKAFITHRIRYT